MATKRPSILPRRLPYRFSDGIFLGLNALLFLSLTCYLIAAYRHMPVEIPVHYGPTGSVDRISSKKEIWVVYAVYAVTLLPMLALVHFPQLFNIPSWADRRTAIPLAQVFRTVLELSGLYVSIIFFWIIAMMGSGSLTLGPFLAFVVLGLGLLLTWTFLSLRRIRSL